MPTDSLTFQEFRILSHDGKMAKAAAQFMYKGREISFSTMFHPFPSTVCVFPNDVDAVYVYECETVEQAIAWCDANPIP